jgi:hypothetical protein
MQLAFNDGSHIVENPVAYAAAHRRLGVGALDPQSQQIAGIAATGVTTAAGILVGLSVIGGPVGAAIAGIASMGIAIANVFSGCGDTCVEATHIADQVGAILAQMFDHYMSAPIHYASMQRAYLIQWDAAWNALVKACSNPALQDAGVRCITDRQRGGCHYHTSPGGWQQQSGQWVYVPPGGVDSGTTCWNWFIGSRDPVANDPTVVPDPVNATVNPDGSVTPNPPLFGASASSLMPLLVIGGAGIAALMLVGDN